MKKIIVLSLSFSIFPFFGVFAMENQSDVADQTKVMGFSFVRNIFTKSQNIDSDARNGIKIEETNSDLPNIQEPDIVKLQNDDVIVTKKDPKPQKIDELKSSISQIIPLAEKFKYPTNRLKLYYKQLDNYTTGNVQKLTTDIRKEINRIKIFIRKKNK